MHARHSIRHFSWSETLVYCVFRWCFSKWLFLYCVGQEFLSRSNKRQNGQVNNFFSVILPHLTHHSLVYCYYFRTSLLFRAVTVYHCVYLSLTPALGALCFVYTNRRRILKREYSFVLWNYLNIRFAYFFFASFNFFCYFFIIVVKKKNFGEKNFFLHKHRVISTPSFG